MAYTFSFSTENYKLNSLERELLSSKDSYEKMQLQIELTDLLMNTDIDRALQIAQQTVELATDKNNRKIKLFAWNQIAEIYRQKNDFRSSLELGNKAKNLASELKQDIEYAKALLTLAGNFTSLGNYEKSASLNFQALKIFEAYNDTKRLGIVYSGIGTNQYYQKNFDNALVYYNKSLSIARDNKDLAGISRGLNNVAIIYGEFGEYESVIKNVKESIEINKILKNLEWESINYLNLAAVYRIKQDFKSAYYFLNKADSIISKQNNQFNICNFYLKLSSYYFDINKLDSSLHFALLAYNIGVDHDLKYMSHESAKQLRNIYNAQLDVTNALKFCLIKEQLKDSLDTKNTRTKISQLELLHEFEKVEQENKIKQQRREFILIISGITIVFVLLVLMGFLVQRHRIKTKNEQLERDRLNLELDSRNKELAANVMTLIRKNEVLSTMGNKLMDIQNKAVKKETKAAIKKIAHHLQQTTENEKWDEFEIRFRQVHSDFYEKLISQFPDLSPNEQRLCAFLRLNMTSKEISQLTGQKIDSLEVARCRLRKKLKITNTKSNLVTFLSNI